MKLFLLCIITVCLIACGDKSLKENQSTDKHAINNTPLQKLFDDYSLFNYQSAPTWAYILGKDEYAGKWADNSLNGIELEYKHIQEFIKEAAKINLDKLNKDEKVYFNLLLNDLNTKKSEYENQIYFFNLTEQYGIHHNIIYTFSSLPAEDKNDLQIIIKLLENTDTQLLNVIDILKLGIKKGLTQPKPSMKGVPNQIETITNTSIEDSPFYKPFKSISNINNSAELELQTKAKQLIKNKIYPAFNQLNNFLKKEYIPNCRDKIGLSNLDKGLEKYTFLAKKFTTTDMTPKQIFDKGLSEVERIKKQMLIIKNQTNFKGNLNEFNNYLRTNPKFFYNTKEELLTGYRDICKRIDHGLVKLFKRLPQLPYGVVPVPEYLEKNYTTARYSSGSMESGKPGEFLANTYDLKSRPKWEMEALSLHEAVPGHHLQLSLAGEIKNQPEFKQFLSYTVYVEGWALYAESLGEDLGLYQDPFSKYGQLTYEMWRAIRLVLDPAIHTMGWSREEAIDFFKENSAKTLKDIEVEVDRYIGWPGQALAYKIGEIKIQELRSKAELELKENFYIRDFHDMLLSNGALPLSVLETMVNDWIETTKNSIKIKEKE